MTRRRILVRAVRQDEGDPTIDLHVYCSRQERSIHLDSCRACPACERVEPDEAGGLGYVVCGPVPEDPPSAGDLLAGETPCAGDDVSATTLRAFFVERGVPCILVVTKSGRLVGVVDEHDFVTGQLGARGRSARGELGIHGLKARDLARAEATVQGSASVREALTRMAETHRRHVVVVDSEGTPLGVLTDLVALRNVAKG